MAGIIYFIQIQVNNMIMMKGMKKLPQQSISKYQRLEYLGKGGFGCVFKAIHLTSSAIVAIKKVEKQFNSRQGVSQSILREVSILKKIDHPSIIKLLDVNFHQCEKYGYLVLEYFPYDLGKVIQNKIKLFSIEETKFIIKQILEGVAHLHSNSILHRDIKPPNILIDLKTLEVKITDFGIARQIHYSAKQYTEGASTIFYLAPEVLMKDFHYTEAIDIWSIGCVFAECVLGRMLFKGSQLNQKIQLSDIFTCLSIQKQLKGQQDLREYRKQLKSIEAQPIEKYVQDLSPIGTDGLDLLNKMLKVDPLQRITAHEALLHPFFKESEVKNNEEESLPACN